MRRRLREERIKSWLDAIDKKKLEEFEKPIKEVEE